ncbi:MAG: citrate lyase holo-[acyl-carrier protein] synthase [Bariatricus sp.]
MQGYEVTLPEMLACRERRALLQQELITKYHCPVISFCMNIPGPVKTTLQIRSAFEHGLQILEAQLKLQNIPVLEAIPIHEVTGDEWIAAVNFPAASIKTLTTQIEESDSFGRLFDIDVIDTTGEKLSRPVYRKCLICGRQAQECASSRRHSVKEMQDKIEEILEKGM